MVYGFMYSYPFSRSVYVFSLRETNVGGTGKNAVETSQLVHKCKEKFKNAILPLKHSSTNSGLKCPSETIVAEEHKGTSPSLPSDLLFPHLMCLLWCPLQRSRAVCWVGGLLPSRAK